MPEVCIIKPLIIVLLSRKELLYRIRSEQLSCTLHNIYYWAHFIFRSNDNPVMKGLNVVKTEVWKLHLQVLKPWLKWSYVCAWLDELHVKQVSRENGQNREKLELCPERVSIIASWQVCSGHILSQTLTNKHHSAHVAICQYVSSSSTYIPQLSSYYYQ